MIQDGPYDRILVGVDPGRLARDAAALAVELAARGGSELIVATVLPPTQTITNGVFRRWLDDDARHLAAAGLPGLEGVRYRICGMAGGSPERMLSDLAEDEGVDVVVLGSTHTGPLGRVLPGPTGERLLQTTTLPIITAAGGMADAGWRLERAIGVADDGSEAAQGALAHASALAAWAALPLHLFAVGGPGEPGEELLAAGDYVDLLVAGSVVRGASCPTLTVPYGAPRPRPQRTNGFENQAAAAAVTRGVRR